MRYNAPKMARARMYIRRNTCPTPSTRNQAPPLRIAPSFPRRREPGRFQTRLPPEIRHESRADKSLPSRPHSVIPAKAGIQRVSAKPAAWKSGMNRERTNPFPRVPIPSFPRKRESRGLKPSLPPEIRHESRATNPFPIHGGRLGWGRGARKRGSAGGTPALPRRQPLQALHAGRLGWARAARKRGFASERLGRVDMPRSRAQPTAFAVWIPAFAGMTGWESGNNGVKTGMMGWKVGITGLEKRK